MDKIIIIDRIETENGFSVKVAFWLIPPDKARYRKVDRRSEVPKASDFELDQIASGAVVERVYESGLLPAATTQAAVDAQLEALFDQFQSALSSELKGGDAINRRFDGTTWKSNGGQF